VVGPLWLVGAKANQVGLAGIRAQDVAHLIASKAQSSCLVVAILAHQRRHEHHVAGVTQCAPVAVVGQALGGIAHGGVRGLGTLAAGILWRDMDTHTHVKM